MFFIGPLDSSRTAAPKKKGRAPNTTIPNYKNGDFGITGHSLAGGK